MATTTGENNKRKCDDDEDQSPLIKKRVCKSPPTINADSQSFEDFIRDVYEKEKSMDLFPNIVDVRDVTDENWIEILDTYLLRLYYDKTKTGSIYADWYFEGSAFFLDDGEQKRIVKIFKSFVENDNDVAQKDYDFKNKKSDDNDSKINAVFKIKDMVRFCTESENYFKTKFGEDKHYFKLIEILQKRLTVREEFFRLISEHLLIDCFSHMECIRNEEEKCNDMRTVFDCIDGSEIFSELEDYFVDHYQTVISDIPLDLCNYIIGKMRTYYEFGYSRGPTTDEEKQIKKPILILSEIADLNYQLEELYK